MAVLFRFKCMVSRSNMLVLWTMIFFTTIAHAAIPYSTGNNTIFHMSKTEKEFLKNEAKQMFYHAYNNYIINAYPADELKPLSCKGRYRNDKMSRGSMDDVLGNFSLTLIDSLDTLALLNDVQEFERGIKRVVKDVTFDHDIVVSVFETNIRVLGGLLSAHVLAEDFKTKYKNFSWYNGELLDKARDLGYRLLPAFDSKTGIPYGRVNLRYGIRKDKLLQSRDTCTACAGTLVLEMAALSRLAGAQIFEKKAQRAMDELWSLRHRTSNLMGTIVDVESGEWIRKEAGVGAGVDSYYEYCLKAYILLADERYLRRFNQHYAAIMMYLSQGPLLMEVHMHKPNKNAKPFMDSLIAFFPGLQVLLGDIKSAVELHETFYSLMKMHTFIPEAFTSDFEVHWGQYPLRPEFIESTYFLYKATGDEFYLDVAKKVLRNLQKHTRVPCGFASLKSVKTLEHEDSMDSYVLAETFKYLYLIFAEASDLPIDIENYVFTTEGHLLPLTLSRTPISVSMQEHKELGSVTASCKEQQIEYHALRKNVSDYIKKICPMKVQLKRLLNGDFSSFNSDHEKMINSMGFINHFMADEKIELAHLYENAISKLDAEEGVIFIREMVKITSTKLRGHTPQNVVFNENGKLVVLRAGPSFFGRLLGPNEKVTGQMAVANPIQACTSLYNEDAVRGKIVVAKRGDCTFVEKARVIQEAGAMAAIIYDNTLGTSSNQLPVFAMSGENSGDIVIPVLFLFNEEGLTLLNARQKNPHLMLSIVQLELVMPCKQRTGFTNTYTNPATVLLRSVFETTHSPYPMQECVKLKSQPLSVGVCMTFKLLEEELLLNMVLHRKNEDKTEHSFDTNTDVHIKSYARTASGVYGNQAVQLAADTNAFQMSPSEWVLQHENSLPNIDYSNSLQTEDDVLYFSLILAKDFDSFVTQQNPIIFASTVANKLNGVAERSDQMLVKTLKELRRSIAKDKIFSRKDECTNSRYTKFCPAEMSSARTKISDYFVDNTDVKYSQMLPAVKIEEIVPDLTDAIADTVSISSSNTIHNGAKDALSYDDGGKVHIIENKFKPQNYGIENNVPVFGNINENNDHIEITTVRNVKTGEHDRNIFYANEEKCERY